MNFILFMALLGLIAFLGIWVKTLADRINQIEEILSEQESK